MPTSCDHNVLSKKYSRNDSQRRKNRTNGNEHRNLRRRLIKPCVILLSDTQHNKTNEEKKRTQNERYRNREIKIVCYADDTVLVVENEDELKRFLREFKINGKKMNISIST